jgi:hypothetical protein
MCLDWSRRERDLESGETVVCDFDFSGWDINISKDIKRMLNGTYRKMLDRLPLNSLDIAEALEVYIDYQEGVHAEIGIPDGMKISNDNGHQSGELPTFFGNSLIHLIIMLYTVFKNIFKVTNAEILFRGLTFYLDMFRS